jgi:glutamate transport system permease protein
MSTVLYDNPGPRTVRRHRIYSVVAWVAILAAIGWLVWTMYRKGELAYELWEPFVTPSLMRFILVEGVLETVQMAFTSIIFAVLFGLVFGVGKMSERRWISWPSWVVVEFFRAVPVLLLMVFIFLTFGIGDGFGPYWSVVFALTLYNGSVLAEVFRAGVEAVPRGQAEAAYAIGMRKTQVMWSVLLPQAVRIMLPAIISQCVVALKDTSLGYYIVAPGLTAVSRSLYLEFNNQFQTIFVLALLYIILNLILTVIATWVQKKFVGVRKLSTAADTGE